jgi:sugar phosphate isomerase/epimerase
MTSVGTVTISDCKDAEMTVARRFNPRLGCSTISFRHLGLADALATIAGLGFTEIDLGALPGVCDHVPYVLDAEAVKTVAAVVEASGLPVRSINADIGDLNRSLDEPASTARREHLDMLVALAVATGSGALVLPCGALDHEPLETLDADLNLVAAQLIAAARVAADHGVELWTESLHFHRLCWNLERAQQLSERLAGTPVRQVMDFSHVVASGGDPVEFISRLGDHISHVHIRDAVPGNINLSVGNGDVDFAYGLKTLEHVDYAGHFSLELETRDITNDERPAATARAGRLISALI